MTTDQNPVADATPCITIAGIGQNDAVFAKDICHGSNPGWVPAKDNFRINNSVKNIYSVSSSCGYSNIVRKGGDIVTDISSGTSSLTTSVSYPQRMNGTLANTTHPIDNNCASSGYVGVGAYGKLYASNGSGAQTYWTPYMTNISNLTNVYSLTPRSNNTFPAFLTLSNDLKPRIITRQLDGTGHVQELGGLIKVIAPSKRVIFGTGTDDTVFFRTINDDTATTSTFDPNTSWTAGALDWQVL